MSGESKLHLHVVPDGSLEKAESYRCRYCSTIQRVVVVVLCDANDYFCVAQQAAYCSGVEIANGAWAGNHCLCAVNSEYVHPATRRA